MQYDTVEGRANYFEEISDGNVELGSAAEHASTTNLGAFGDRSHLKDDCARIFAEEIRAYCIKYGIDFPLDHALDAKQAVLCTSEFQNLFNLWRRDVDYHTEATLATVIESISMPTPPREYSVEERQLLDNSHEFIIEALRSYDNEFMRRF